jgi:hypothetical protein
VHRLRMYCVYPALRRGGGGAGIGVASGWVRAPARIPGMAILRKSQNRTCGPCTPFQGDVPVRLPDGRLAQDGTI